MCVNIFNKFLLNKIPIIRDSYKILSNSEFEILNKLFVKTKICLTLSSSVETDKRNVLFIFINLFFT